MAILRRTSQSLQQEAIAEDVSGGLTPGYNEFYWKEERMKLIDNTTKEVLFTSTDNDLLDEAAAAHRRAGRVPTLEGDGLYHLITRTYPPCNYCRQAKGLLKMKGLEYVEYELAEVYDFFEGEGYRSVPQVFLGGLHSSLRVGGYEELEKELNNDK